MHPQVSTQIALLRIGLICGLVFLHYGSFPGTTFTHFDGYQGSPYPIASLLNCGILFFFYSAVPLLSIISGYLFFRNANGSTQFFLAQLKKRFTSVAVPMFIWNNIWLLVPLSLVLIGKKNGWTAEFGDNFNNYNLLDYLNSTIGIQKFPIAFQFWYVRDLILCFLFSPLVFLGIRLIPLLFIFGLTVLWVTNSNLGLFFRIDILLFFTIGCLLTRTPSEKLLCLFSIKQSAVILFGYFCIICIRITLPNFIDSSTGFGHSIIDLLTKGMRLGGVITFWIGAAHLIKTNRIPKLTARFSSYAFFLFAAHWPTLSFVKSAVFRIYPISNNFVFIVNLLVVPTLTIIGILLLARFMDQQAPNTFRLLNGGRNSGS